MLESLATFLQDANVNNDEQSKFAHEMVIFI